MDRDDIKSSFFVLGLIMLVLGLVSISLGSIFLIILKFFIHSPEVMKSMFS